MRVRLEVVRKVGAMNDQGAVEEYGYTFCDGCNEVPFCGIRYTRKGDVVTKVEPWPGFPAGPPCSKGYATLQRLYNPERLTYPLKRTRPKGAEDPGFSRISWDEAYETITGELLRIRDEHGRAPACVAGCPSRAMTFGDLDDPTDPVAAKTARSEAMHPDAGSRPKVTYLFPSGLRDYVDAEAKKDPHMRG